MTGRFTAEAFAASSRRRGFSVARPAKDDLEAQLRATLARLQAGESLSSLARGDGVVAFIAAARERPLDELEAINVLAGNQYLEMCLASAEAQISAAKASAAHERENAAIWGRSCADLGRSFEAIATEVGDIVLAQDPERLAEVVRDLLRGRLPEGTITVADEVMAKALLLVAKERHAQEEKWGAESMSRTCRPLKEPKHGLAVLMEEVGEVSRAILEHEGDERLLAELVQVAAVACVWTELLLRNHEQATKGAAAAAETVPHEQDANAHVTGHGSAGCRPSEHAAAGGAGNTGTGARDARLQGPTGLPRDATTSAIVAASNELHEHRVAARLIASSLGDPALAEDPRRLADRVAETIEAAEATHDDDEAAHQETLDLLARAQGENAQLHEDNLELQRKLDESSAQVAELKRELAKHPTEADWRDSVL